MMGFQNRGSAGGPKEKLCADLTTLKSKIDISQPIFSVVIVYNQFQTVGCDLGNTSKVEFCKVNPSHTGDPNACTDLDQPQL